MDKGAILGLGFILMTLVWLNTATCQPTPEMLEFIKKEKTTNEEDDAFVKAVTLWADKDLTSAQKWAYSFEKSDGPNGRNYSYATMGVMDSIAKKGVKPAFEWIKGLNSTDDRIDAIIVFQNFFQNIPAVQVAEAGLILEPGSEEQLSLANGFVSAKPVEVPKLFNFAMELKEEKYRDSILMSALFAINKTDPNAAMNLWESMPEIGYKDQLYGQYFAKSIEGRPAVEALEWLKMHKFDGVCKSGSKSNIIRNWTDSEPDAAGDYILSESGNNPKPIEIMSHVKNLSKKWPEKVLPWLKKLPDGFMRKYHMEKYATELLELNPELFEKIKEETKDPEIFQALDQASFSRAKNKGPEEACRSYLTLNPGPKKEKEMEFLISCLQWHEKNPVEFMRWARTLRGEQFKTINAFLQATSKKYESEESATYVTDEMALGAKRDSAIVSIANKKAREDPKGAALWAQQLPPDNARIEAIEAVAVAWSIKDPSAACDWIKFIADTIPEKSIAIPFPFLALSKTNPLLALQKAIKLKTSLARDNIVSIASHRLSEENSSQLQEFIVQTKDPKDRSLMLSMFLFGSSKDPQEYKKNADWLLQIKPWPFEKGENNPYPALLTLWAEKDGAGCLQWVRGAPIKNTQEAEIKATIIANLMAGNDPFLSGGKDLSSNEDNASLTEGENIRQADDETAVTKSQKTFGLWGAKISEGLKSTLIVCLFMAGSIGWSFFKLKRIFLKQDIPRVIKITVCLMALYAFAGVVFQYFVRVRAIGHPLLNVNFETVFGELFVYFIYAIILILLVNQTLKGSRVVSLIASFGIIWGVISFYLAFIWQKQNPHMLATGTIFNPFLGLNYLLVGALFVWLFRNSKAKEFRAQKRSNKKGIPPIIWVSFLLLNGQLFFGAIYSLYTQKSGGVLTFVFGAVLLLSLFWLPILSGLRWGDPFALRIFYFVCLIYLSFPLYFLFKNLTSSPLEISRSNLSYLVAYLLACGILFLPSMRKWARELKPVF